MKKHYSLAKSLMLIANYFVYVIFEKCFRSFGIIGQGKLPLKPMPLFFAYATIRVKGLITC